MEILPSWLKNLARRATRYREWTILLTPAVDVPPDRDLKFGTVGFHQAVSAGSLVHRLIGMECSPRVWVADMYSPDDRTTAHKLFATLGQPEPGVESVAQGIHPLALTGQYRGLVRQLRTHAPDNRPIILVVDQELGVSMLRRMRRIKGAWPIISTAQLRPGRVYAMKLSSWGTVLDPGLTFINRFVTPELCGEVDT